MKTKTSPAAKQPPAPRPRIRWARPADIEAMLRNERSWATSKEDCWCANGLLEYLPSPHHSYTTLALELPGTTEVVGHAQVYIRPTDLSLSNVCVRREHARKGFGAALVRAVRHLPRDHRNLFRNQVWAITRERDLATQLFLRAQGFRCVEIKRDWYHYPPEDGYLFSAMTLIQG